MTDEDRTHQDQLRRQKNRERSIPLHIGTSWTPEEDQALRREYRADRYQAQLAHLVLLGLLDTHLTDIPAPPHASSAAAPIPFPRLDTPPVRTALFERTGYE